MRHDIDLTYSPTWCPGCGNFGIFNALRKAVGGLGLDLEQTVLVTGIGCSSKISQYLNLYRIETLHGRTLPVATGVKLANHRLTVIAEGGDGDGMGLGMGHFIHTARRNLDITYLIHNNQIYGLTKGQASPTSDRGAITKFTPPPLGNIEQPVNIVQMALQSGATFVARSYAADPAELTAIITAAVAHPGFAVVDILQPCVSFNHVNTYAWYKERVYKVSSRPEGYDPSDFTQAAAVAGEWGAKIPTGIFYRTQRMTFESSLPQLSGTPLAGLPVDGRSVSGLMEELA